MTSQKIVIASREAARQSRAGTSGIEMVGSARNDDRNQFTLLLMPDGWDLRCRNPAEPLAKTIDATKKRNHTEE